MLDLWLAVLLGFSLKGLVLCLVAALAGLALWRATAGRPVVWRLAFAGLLALPVLATADDDRMIFQLSQDDRRLEIRTQGKFTLTDVGTGIAGLSPGAKMRFEEDDGTRKRRLDVEPAADGSPVYTWRINGKKHAFDAEARQWLRGMLVAGRLVREAPGTGHPHGETADPL